MPAIDRIARAQYGLITRHQLAQSSVSPDTVKRWLGKGRLQLVHPTVYRMAGAPLCWQQRILAAVFGAGAGAVASHRTAARLWGLIDEDVVEITVPAPRWVRLEGVQVHRSAETGRRWLGRRRGIPATKPLRIMVDIGGVVARAAVVRVPSPAGS